VNRAYATSARPAAGVSRLAAWMQSASVEVWVKFLLALLGLGLAFAAALFSTTSREAGNLWVSVALASLSLLLAALVGLVTVPYLARRVAVERLRESFDYEVTRVGVVYVLVTLVIAIAALNTGNNLLYIVVAAMLAAILVSGVVSALVLRDLELDVRLPEHVFAGRPVAGRIVLKNPRRFLPSFSIQAVTARKRGDGKKIRKQWRLERTTFAFPASRPPESQWLRLRDWRVRRVAVAPAAPGIFEGAVYFPYVPRRAESSADLELCFARRGRYCESGFGLATRFPFAFLTKTRQVALEREILVYPPVEPADELFEILPLVRGEWESFVRGRGSDLYRIREYMPEDSARHVDWKATAKSGSLKVREFSREDERKLRLVFDNPQAGAVSKQAYERAVNLAASLAWHFSEENAEVSFVVPGSAPSGDLHQFLAKLALIAPVEPRKNAVGEAGKDNEKDHNPKRARHGADDMARQLELADLGPGPADQYNIVLTARPQGGIPTALWNSSYFVFIGEAFDHEPERRK